MAKEPNHDERLKYVLLWSISSILIISSLYHIGVGTYALVLIGFPVDLRQRWVEHRYIIRHGQDPFDLYFRYEPQGPIVPPKPIVRNTAIDPELGGVYQLAYPPWTYILGSVIFWPDWPAVRWWTALLNWLSLALVGAWAYRSARPSGRGGAMVTALICLACSNNLTNLMLGQLAIVVLAFLVAALLLDEAGHDVLSGVCLGMATIKPTITVPFLLIPLVRGRWKSLMTAVALVAAASGFVWLKTGVGTLEMLQQMTAVAEQVEMLKGEPGLITWLISMGMKVSVASKVTAGLSLALCALMLCVLRHRPVGVLYAVAAVTAQLWTHHKGYDEVVVLLMTVPLVSAALIHGKSWALLAVSAAVVVANLQLGMSHVIPSIGVRVAIQTVLWVIGAIVYLSIEHSLSRATRSFETVEQQVLRSLED